MNTKIILLLSGTRSGSTYFIDCFNNFNNIDIEYEIFNSTATQLSSKLNNKYLHDLMVVKYGINYKSIVTSKFSKNNIWKTIDDKYLLAMSKNR